LDLNFENLFANLEKKKWTEDINVRGGSKNSYNIPFFLGLIIVSGRTA